MLHRRFGQVICLWIALLAAPPAWGQQQAGDRIEQFQAAVESLDLSADQQQQLDRVFARMREQSAEARALRREDPQAARSKLREIAAEMRSEVARILTPQQQQALRRQMQRQSETAPPPAAPPNDPRQPDPMRDAPAHTQPTASQPPPISDTDTRFTRAGNPLPVGQDAPPVSLTDLNGRRVTLDTLPRRPVVLIFGSYSCPAFREQIPMLNQLADAHARRAHFLIAYTREAHAVGQWEVQRNRDENIQVAPHSDIDARKSVAIAAQKTLGIKLPIALDDMDDTTVRAYDAFPNGAVVLSADRKVLTAQRWADPFLLDEVLMAIGR